MVIPRPKRIEGTRQWCVLDRNSSIGSHDVDRSLTTRVREAFGAATGLRLHQGQSALHGVCLQRVKRLPGIPCQAEGYVIQVTPSLATLSAVTERGLWYAVQSLIGMTRVEGARVSIPCGAVRDWPDFSYRGFMADPARCFITPERMRWYIDYLSRNKYNQFHVHFSDAESFTLPSVVFPKLNALCDPPHGVYSKADLNRINQYASERYVELVPEIDLPGHATFLVQQYPELKCQTKSEPASSWTICIGAETTYRFLDRLIGEVAALFPGRFLHLGTDELEFLDMIERVHASWRECPACRRRMAREHLTNSRQLFYYFMRRMRDMAARYGKRLIMWNDSIDIAHPHSVPHDILQQFWRIAAVGHGPFKGCTLTKFLQDGFQAINSYYPETYLDGYIEEQRLVKWNPLSSPAVPARYQARILGGECCAWSDGAKDNYLRSLPSALPMFADRVWNQAPIDDPDAFAEGLARHIFGPRTPAGLNRLFPTLGMMALYSNKQVAYKPVLLKAIPRDRRLALCAQLRRLIRREQTKNHLMNTFVLAEYDRFLMLLQRALKSDLCPMG
ncbi:MAG: beta-N-acetylhexosaminidase [Verrucomicrobia bacterium]|nr:beta-N-acetylhexosaminidase [Verrucomicrobiota bacterium]